MYKPSREVLARWSEFTEEEIARAGPKILAFYRAEVLPHLKGTNCQANQKTELNCMEYDPAPRRCMVRFRVSPKEMEFYRREAEKRGFASMADFFREAVRRMIFGV